MVVETILGAIVALMVGWLFVYSAALFGARHALEEYFEDDETEAPSADESSPPRE